MRGGITVEALEPGLFPEDQASGLAPVMGRSVAPDVLKVNAARHLPAADSHGRIAGLVGTFAHAQRLPTIPEHLRHEWQLLELALLVQRTENLLLRPDLHPFTSAEAETSRSRVIDVLHQRRTQV